MRTLTGEQRRHDAIEKLVDLLGSTPDEPAWLERVRKLGERNAERRIVRQPVEQIVAIPAVLQGARGFDRMLANALVRRLTIAARAYGAHDELLGGHERQLVSETPANSRRVHFQAARHVFHEDQDRIDGEKAFRNDEPAIGAVVERPLEELNAVGEIRVR